MGVFEIVQSLGVVVVCVAIYAHIANTDDAAPFRVVVLGGAGFQGQGFIEAFLQQQRPTPVILRVVSRNISQLRRFPWHNHTRIELFEGDVYNNDAALAQAFHAQHGLFLVTFSDFAHDTERAHGLRLIDAAKNAHIEHVAFSGGAATGKPTLDVKAGIEEVLRQHPWRSLSVWHSGFFYENLVLKGGKPRLQCQRDGGKTFLTLTAPFPADFDVVMHTASDVGRGAVQHLRNTLRITQRRDFSQTPSLRWHPAAPAIRLAGQKLTPAAYAAAVEAYARKQGVDMTVTYEAMPVETLVELLGGKEGEVVGDMFQWVLAGGMQAYDSDENVTQAREAYRAMDVAMWLGTGGFQLIQDTCNAVATST